MTDAARTRLLLTLAGLGGIFLLAAIVYASTANSDAYATHGPDAASTGTVVVNSAVIVFREGLEAVLIFAAVTASMVGVQRSARKPVAAGLGIGLAATVLTWFGAVALLSQFDAYSGELQAITGLIAVGVLLLVLNWFLHKVYWTGYIAHHHRRRRKAMEASGTGILSGQLIGLLLLGFTTVYREGFEVVVFLQTLRLDAGSAVVLEGVAIGLLGIVGVGAMTFVLQRKLPYKKMLVVTGVMIGFVLVVMVGGTARTFQDLGWLSTTSLGVSFPDWMARWFEVVPTVETLACQVVAAGFVIGSYYAAEHVKVRRPRARGEKPARRAEQPAPVFSAVPGS